MKILSRLRALLTAARHYEEQAVHFHSGPHGQPVVCENPRCESPHLSV